MSDSRSRYSSAPLQNVKKAVPPKRGNKPQPPRTVGDYQDTAVGQRSFALLQVLLTIGLPLFFVIALLMPSNSLYLIFSAVSTGCLVLMWLLNAFVPNARMTLSFIHIAMILVCLFAVWMSAPSGQTIGQAGQGAASANAQGDDLASIFEQNANTGMVGLAAQQQSQNDFQVEATANPGAASLAQKRLEEFMSGWMNNDFKKMVSLSLPSWVSSHEDAEQAMFFVRGIRMPLSFEFLSVTGSDADNTRTVNMQVKMDKSNGQTPRSYLMQVLMMRVNDQWYVDPNSLTSEQEVADSSVTGIPVVTIAPAITALPSQQLFYNPEGGSKYHLDPNCKSVNPKYQPLQGSFVYSQINDAQFSNLEPCTDCRAPKRM